MGLLNLYNASSGWKVDERRQQHFEGRRLDMILFPQIGRSLDLVYGPGKSGYGQAPPKKQQFAKALSHGLPESPISAMIAKGCALFLHKAYFSYPNHHGSSLADTVSAQL